MDLFRSDALLPVWGDDYDMQGPCEAWCQGVLDTPGENMFIEEDNVVNGNYQQEPQQQDSYEQTWNQNYDQEPQNQDNHFYYYSSTDSSFSASTDSEIEEVHDQQVWVAQENGHLPPQEQDPQQYAGHYSAPYPYKNEEIHDPCFNQGLPLHIIANNNPPCTTDDEMDNSNCDRMDAEDPVDFKLPASKTPIMEAMVVCALNNWGLSVVKSSPHEVIFRVTDFDRYYRISRAICSKHRPTEDIGSRVKSLRRWFVNFPKKRDRQENPNFLLSVKPNTCKKVHGLIERNSKLLSAKKKAR